MLNRAPTSSSAPRRRSRLRRILIANRGEVALRVARACREMGIGVVGVYSEVDREALHVAAADQAVLLGSNSAAESYLNIQAILRAAAESEADAVHPGFGFLSENADFAAAVRHAGLTFIGPATEAIRLMGSKARARQFVHSLGVPVIPGYDGADQSPRALVEAAHRIGFPLMIKAASGGGGMGIRVVEAAADLERMLASAAIEARAAFGDTHLVLERFLDTVRHVEVQIVGDEYGRVVHCFDRECSVQRRRQKIVEEAPAVMVPKAVRDAMAAAAVRIGEAARYVGLGTVEFVYDDATRQFHFLEMNTRLQVEHGLTEMITGIDLVRWQIELAEGAPLGREQADIVPCGHAIECRLYAEDPSNDFAPSPGRVLHWAPAIGAGVRVDTAVASGTEVSSYYDPMIAKVITHGCDRDAALRSARAAVARTEILGVQTNQDFLLRLLDHPDMRRGATSTRMVEALRARLTDPPSEHIRLRARVAASIERWLRQEPVAHRDRSERAFVLRDGTDQFVVTLRRVSDAEFVAIDAHAQHRVRLLQRGDAGSGMLEIDGVARPHRVLFDRDLAYVRVHGEGAISLSFESRFARSRPPDDRPTYEAAMTGRVIEVLVQPGSRVRQGDRLLTIESMKMELATIARADGVVREINARVGEIVEKGSLLIAVDGDVTTIEAQVFVS